MRAQRPANRRRARARQPVVIECWPIDSKLGHVLGLSEDAAALVAPMLVVFLDEIVRARWPGDWHRWRLLTSRRVVRPYLAVSTPTEPRTTTHGELSQHEQKALIIVEPLLGQGLNVVDPIRFLPALLPAFPTEPTDLSTLCKALSVTNDGIAVWAGLDLLRGGAERTTRELRCQVEINAERMHAAMTALPAQVFARTDWRRLSKEEKLSRIDHAVALLRAAEGAGRSPPSWRTLAAEVGVSGRTLRKIESIADAMTDAQSGFYASKRAATSRHTAPRESRRGDG